MSTVNYKNLTEEQKAERRRYQREYRHTHKDRVREWNRRFYLKQAMKINAQQSTADTREEGVRQ